MNIHRLHFNRRDFCAIAGSTVASFALGTGCRRGVGSNIANDGKLTARPHDGGKTSAGGRIMLGLDRKRDAILELPKTGGPSPLPLLVMLHGAGQSAEDMFWYLGSAHEQAGVAVLAPNSRDNTWDVLGGSFGSDVKFLNRALERVFDTAAIDPMRVAVGGFSDGASYALSLGLINGDLFSRVVAFSPGFVVDGAPHGKPYFFISHGTRDHILPIGRCSRRIVAELKTRRYDVTYREFDGDHDIPPEVAREGLMWVAAFVPETRTHTPSRLHELPNSPLEEERCAPIT
jgi:phospholipase/carboxylesterase